MRIAFLAAALMAAPLTLVAPLPAAAQQVSPALAQVLAATPTAPATRTATPPRR